MDSQLANNHIEKLVRLSSRGDAKAYRRLFEHLHRQLFGFIVSRTASREDAKDILQEVLVDLWQALPRFSYWSDKQFYSFVYTISKRKLARYYDSLGKTVELTESHLSDHYEQESGEAVLLGRLVRRLKPKYREVMELRYWSDLTFAEIAKLLKAKETTVKVRHHRALKQLNILLDEYEE